MNPHHAPLRTLPEIALAAPLMLGYWPEDSVCVIVVDGDGRVLLMMRWPAEASLELSDLPDLGPSGLDAAGFHVIVVPAAGVDAHEVALVTAADLEAMDLPALRLLALERQGASVAWQSFGAHGRSVRGTIDEQRIAAVAGRWGLPPWAPSRHDYVSDIARRPERRAEVGRCLPDVDDITETSRDAAIRQSWAALTGQWQESPEAIAHLLVAVDDVVVRDTLLWDLMSEGPCCWPTAADRLAHAVAAAPAGRVAAAATVLALLRWQMGDGSRALAAVERALEDRPSYSLAQLVDCCLGMGMHPATWREGVVGMRREDCRRPA